MSAPRRVAPATAIIAVLATAFLYLPLAVIVGFSFNSAPHGAWREFTLQWYFALARNGVALNAAKTTALLAAGSTLISTVLGTMLALGLSRSFRFRRTLEAGVMLPVVVPDIIMAVGLLLLFREFRERLGWFEPGLLTMIIGHVTFQIPFVALVVRARLSGLDASLEEAARDLGATPWQAFWRIKFPLIAPGIAAGALLAVTLSLDDFVVSFFTTGPGATTLPILIYSSVKRGITPEINAISSLFILAAILGSVALAGLGRRQSR
jgi:spermidine/putrescine transport system permease protein